MTLITTNIVIISCWIIMGAFWLITSIFTKRTAWRPRLGRRVLVGVILVIAGTFLFGKWSKGGWGPALYTHTTSLVVICDVAAVIALVILLWARVTLGRNWSGRIVLKEGHELVTVGPYAYVRHPIYSGFLLLALATAIDLGTLAAFAGYAIFLCIFIWRTYEEDALMLNRFPDQYPAYKAKTKRLVPWVW